MTTFVADTRRCDGRVRPETALPGHQLAFIRERARTVRIQVEAGPCRYLHLVFSGLRLASASAPRPLLLTFSRTHHDATTDPSVSSLGRLLDSALTESPENTPLLAHLALAMRALITEPETTAPPAQAPGLSDLQLKRALAFINSHFGQALKLPDIAAACALSPGHFARAFQRSTGKTPYRWLLERRIHEAQRLMVETPMPLIDVGSHCGFASQSHFTRIFRNAVGVPPGVWRRSADSHG
ncbi:helix-turn-helix domain-containing protein [Luteibacter aegosomatissinici]|uniref:helix-turn-helix domain-containing protein n=1 Tax=Luteibacter aegosomatissinici TaxID=2911539 RepID=UPI001FF89AA8|nr:AraC family transcriptional regulator [Luteibacter aegosomatissinici]UPG92718.1 AraC family transcriptional regulator [Luteibacter aegosomatissinici]